MMHEPTWDAPPVPLTFSPEMIRDDGKGRNKISGGPGEPQTINLPVPADVMTAATSGKVTTASTMQWTYTPKDGRFTPKNQIVRSIIEATAREGWKRPVYFSVTSGDEYAGLYPFCVQQGMAYRVMPVPGGNGRMDIEATKGALLGALEGDEYTVEPKRAFKFRGLADRSVSLLGQDDHRRPINLFYHQIFLTLAEQMIYFENDPAGAVEVLDKMIALVPPDRAGPPVPYGEVYSFYIRIAELYQDAGAAEKAKTWATQALDELARIGSYPRGGYGGQDIPPAMAQAKGLSISGQHDQALNLLDQMLAQQPNDQNAQLERDAVRIWKALAAGDTTAARLSMQQALESYGSPEDMRSQVLMSRFPDLFGTSAFPADDAVAEVTEAAGAGE
mgnify:CR=1 FL=1